MQRWFTAVDRDHSGKINATELQSALVNAQGKHFSDIACQLMIGMFDHDKNGTIDVTEFQQLYAYINQWLTVFKNYDRDQSGHIEEAELAQGKQYQFFKNYFNNVLFYQHCSKWDSALLQILLRF